MFPTLKKNNAATGYKGLVKTELLKSAGLLPNFPNEWRHRLLSELAKKLEPIHYLCVVNDDVFWS